MTPHPQAEILRAIADGEEIEAICGEGWYGVMPRSALRYIYDGNIPLRIKPKTININGIEVPEPMREEPKRGAQIWVADLMSSAGTTAINWYPGNNHKGYLEAGLCHLTQEAAELHAKALLSFTRRI